MSDDGAKRFSISLTASIAAHVALAIALLVAPSVLPTAEHVRPDAEFTIEIAEDEVPPEVVPDLPPEVPETPETIEPETPPPVAPPPRSRPAPAPAAVIAMPEPSVSITPETPEPERTPSEPDREMPIETEEQRRERMRVLLDPSAVARSSFVIEGEGPSRPRSAGMAAAPGASGTGLAPRSEAEVERDLAGSLRAEAMTKTHTTRTTLRARPRPDGTFVYAGHAFTATITADGEVEYEDRPAVQTDGIAASGSFDLGDMIMRSQGQDPYAAERLRFEEDNAELIARLESQARARQMATAMRRLQGQLRRIWDDESRPAAQRRRLIFEQWAEVDESGGGGGAREVIEQFVRENLPAGSADAFEAEELRRLNATLRGTGRFEPYR